jgi:hypothetical protein
MNHEGERIPRVTRNNAAQHATQPFASMQGDPSGAAAQHSSSKGLGENGINVDQRSPQQNARRDAKQRQPACSCPPACQVAAAQPSARLQQCS